MEIGPHPLEVSDPRGEALPAPVFEDVFDSSHRYVWRVLAKLGVPAADVPDVCQDVFVVVHRRLADYDGTRASLRSWIYGICVRTASDHRRRARVRKERPEDPLPDTAVPSHQEDDVERTWARARLTAALAELDDDKRAVFVLFELEELPMTEVAVAVGCPLQTAYSRLYAARDAVSLAFQRPNLKRSKP